MKEYKYTCVIVEVQLVVRFCVEEFRKKKNTKEMPRQSYGKGDSARDIDVELRRSNPAPSPISRMRYLEYEPICIDNTDTKRETYLRGGSIVEPAIPSNHQRAAAQLLRGQGVKDALHEILEVMRLHEDARLLAQARCPGLLPVEWRSGDGADGVRRHCRYFDILRLSEALRGPQNTSNLNLEQLKQRITF